MTQLDRLSGMLDGPPKKLGLNSEAVPALIPHDPFVDPLDRQKAQDKGRGGTLSKEVCVRACVWCMSACACLLYTSDAADE